MAFDPGKLFRRADEVLRLELEESFRRSPVGSIIRQGRARPAVDPSELFRKLERGMTLKELMGTSIWEIKGAIEQYAGRSEWTVVKQFLRSLGPVGTLLENIFQPLSKPPYEAPGFRLSVLDAINFLRAFGFEVLPPKEMRLPKEELERSIWAAYYFLQEHADMLLRRPEFGLAGLAPKPSEVEEEVQERRETQLRVSNTVMVPMRFGPPREFPVTHPIVTGEMVEVRSSNVHSIGYDIDNHILYVRFWAETERKGQLVRFPGSLYGYRDVWPEEFLDFLEAGSKGGWVWDHLRERGTVSGHKKPYFLAGITGGYVPRQAALTTIRGPRTGKPYIAEVFRPRVVFHEGKWLESKLPLEVVQVFKVVKPPRPSLRPLLGLS
ncbi:MAG: KTSC domain-containing protein [Thermogutta sp.]|uniref:KTSC domain-containing protein n=1 Tax=Thermogutta sp. TaxID=1962930 RepID=UPI0019A640C2|nr:KTSC domain-containing protein [Thermogutta sp.]MBC7351501.1 KTSC domain-containing protein [Thermogutta sp.]